MLTRAALVICLTAFLARPLSGTTLWLSTAVPGGLGRGELLLARLESR